MGRRYCKGCQKPLNVCLCAFIDQQENNLPILILQHEDEYKKPLSTVPLAVKGLSQVKALSGLEFDPVQCLSVLDDLGCSNPILLYPSTTDTSSESLEIDLNKPLALENPFLRDYDGLIVLDGTWRNTRELVLTNSWLESLPTLGLKNVGVSRYRIRKSTYAESLSTIEAIAKILSITEQSFKPEVFLLPFEKMIDQQIEYMGEEVFRRNYS